ISGLAFAAIAIVGQYLLWESMLRGSTVLNAGAGRRFFAFFFQAILIGLGTGFGFLFLIVPGLLFAARWAAAPAFLIVERMGIIDAMSASWNMVKGNSRHVIIAYVLAAVVVIGLSGAIAGASLLGGFDTSGQQGLGTMIGLHLVQQLATVLTVGLGVFLFHRLQGASQQLTEVFD
ncbi:MAG TPA: hypothetical protein VLA37_10495, partial [Sphingomonadaceae bacterium]|nr:hypothetical protein [Sphingomonadaceae bacterium]